MNAEQAGYDSLTSWSARNTEGQEFQPYIHEANTDDSGSDSLLEGHISWEELALHSEVFESWGIPADNGTDHGGSNEPATASTTCTCATLFAKMDRKISDLCCHELNRIRRRLAAISSRLSALEAQAAQRRPDQLPQGPLGRLPDEEPRAHRRSGGRPRKAGPERTSGAAKAVNTVKLLRVWLGHNHGDRSHEYTFKGSREPAEGYWRSDTIGADTTLEGAHFALMTDILSLEVEINSGSHFPITLQWNDKSEVFEGQDMLGEMNLLIKYWEVFEMLCNPYKACTEWQVC
ncbi:hypothetical protein HRG_001421 [Hirsutella rhossiliensis]|uniref:Uncharacterized protein n=1 Tax=Hirsutella rhossiliensis TaxID=111463 RepID=A0A9P8SNU8_9HYPO|nr:uncharacterized protein HRG_01421 [Hirsutella rhossiliensis]KAH0968779.1 hypothetical protein HRG_01421 [Hirsutella rhossiliensis]